MEQNSNIANKLKNKKKDVIFADNMRETPIKKSEENTKDQNNSINSSENKQNNLQNPLLEDFEKEKFAKKEINNSTINQKDITDDTNKERKMNEEKKDVKNLDAEQSSTNNNYINHVIFNIQLFFSQNKKICPKIYELLINFLSVDHLKAILEERDCLELCGNILCNNQLSKLKTKKYFYNSKTKEFEKEDVLSFFCDVRCFQKFKDAMKIANNFDYLRLFKFDTLYVLYNSKNFYIGEIYLKKIAYLIKPLYENSLKNVDEITIDIIKTKYENYFNVKNDETNKNIENEIIDSKENVIQLNTVFEDKINLNN